MYVVVLFLWHNISILQCLIHVKFVEFDLIGFKENITREIQFSTSSPRSLHSYV